MTQEAELVDFLRRAEEFALRHPDLARYAPDLHEQAEVVRRPFNLAVVGRMKAGKSTLINSLLGKVLALSDVEEATATINWITHGTTDQGRQFVVRRKDGSSEVLPLAEITRYSGKDEATLERIASVAWLEFFDPEDSLKEIQIVDTPGTGSAVGEHESVAQIFLDPSKIHDSVAEGRKADAILYVVPPVGRETDKGNLDSYAGSRLPGSGPYNSIGVLHKWDALEDEDPRANAHGKAARLAKEWAQDVATVLPVSGPIALAARCAPPGHWQSVMEHIAPLEEPEFVRLMRRNDKWDARPNGKSLRTPYPGFPWASFCLACKELRRVRPSDDKACRETLLMYSGIEALHRILKDKIFSRSRIIKQANVLARSAKAVEPMIRTAMALENRFREDARMLAQYCDPRTDSAARWIQKKTAEWEHQAEVWSRDLLALDRDWQNLKYRLSLLHNDLRLLDLLDERPDIFPQADHHAIRAACNHAASLRQRTHLGRATPISLREVQDIIARYREKAVLAPADQRPSFEHCVRRFEQIHQEIINT
jgi:hypothetical protein